MAPRSLPLAQRPGDGKCRDRDEKKLKRHIESRINKAISGSREEEGRTCKTRTHSEAAESAKSKTDEGEEDECRHKIGASAEKIRDLKSRSGSGGLRPKHDGLPGQVMQ